MQSFFAALRRGLALCCLGPVFFSALALAQGLTPATRGVPLPGPGPKAYVAIVIDDLPNLELWSRLATDCDSHGMKATLALNTLKATPEEYAILAGHIAKGHEVANHTRDHVAVAPGPVIRLRFFHPSAKSAYAAVDAAAGKLRLVVDDAAKPLAEFDLSEAGRTPTIKQLVDALNDTRGVTAELGDPYYGNIQSRFLAGKDKVDIFFKNGLVPLFVDTAQSARYEMAGALDDMKTGLPRYAVTSMVYPFLVSDPVSRGIASELGMGCGRVGTAGFAALGAPGGYDLYQIYAGKPRDLFGTDTASPEFRAKVEAFLKKIKEIGGVLSLYSHGPDEFTNEQWQALLPMLAKDKDVAYVTLRDLAATVKKLATPRDGRYYLPQAK
ncbi:polysaccharide deacetylase family protein [Solidesulfovibrio sp.]|uniref:polysaccharide deacetylase family protein n=1 Tax=Solidesulfovibrio sp. TaxID=2910990 RepID=UPI002B1EFD86|nr:polysaccharide deacetylase family protein [Solidesulfovibrio sp.]MEA4858751.1 polysaccharide deacetylase family protein [Solidesulfovibrio sp.]